MTLRFFKKSLRWILLGLLLAYFAAAATMLAIRFWVLPRINEWRPLIEQTLSNDLGSKVSIGNLTASWSGLSPTLIIENLAVRDQQDTVLLSLPHAFASVSWRSFLDWDVRFNRLEINGVALSIARDSDGVFTVAGMKLDAQHDTHTTINTDTPFVQWLLRQGKVLVQDATIRWTDQFRSAPELTFTGVDLVLNNGLLTHRFLLNAQLPDKIGQRVELIVQTNHLITQIASSTKREAEIYLEIQDLEPQSLSPWLGVPKLAGRFSSRVWIDVLNGKLGHTILEIAGNKPGFEFSDDSTQVSTKLSALRADIRLTGLLSSFLPSLPSEYLASNNQSPELKASVSFKDLVLKSELFKPSELNIGNVTTALQLLKKDESISALNISDLQVDNPGIQFKLAGNWKPDQSDPLGTVDLNASISSLSASQLHQYLTPVTDDDTRLWLKTALTKGQFSQLTFAMKGGLSHVPFNQPTDSGLFKLSGQFNNLTIDYAPPHANDLGWPALKDAAGQINLDKLDLSLQLDQATLLGAKGEQVGVQSLKANIPDMMLKPVLSIQAATADNAKDYIGMLRYTPLNSAAGELFDQLYANGVWTVPLDLLIDLQNPNDAKVKGQILFNGSALGMGDDFPRLENIQGTLDFANTVFKAQDISARFLGGDVSISGIVGEPGGKISIEGQAIVDGVREYANVPALSVLKGRTQYRAQIAQNNRDGLDVSLNTALEGLEVNLPSPIGKVAATKMPLSLRWSTQKVRKDTRHSVNFSLSDVLNARLEKAAGVRSKSFFTNGAITMGSQAELPPKGMSVALSLDALDWAQWGDLFDRLTADKTSSKSEKTSSPIFPFMENISLKTPKLAFEEMVFTDLHVSGRQPEAGQWQVSLQSKETEGSISMQLASGALAGRVNARFSRLELGSPATSPESIPNIQSMNENQWSDIPAIDLTVEDFKLYGSRLGTLHFRGENIQRGETWKIEKLEVKNPFATLNADGQWRLKGGHRGIQLDLNLDISDLGQLTTMMGHPERVRDGSGNVKAKIDWSNFPWVFSYEGMNGKATVDLKKGVFEHVNSRSARLLELLSLQSLQRILSFNFRTGNEFRDGYPWNEIVGDFEIEQGIASTMGLVVDSSIATISMVGSSDLNNKTWNMDADVKPRFDMSGTAVATGFVVNPIVGVSALVTQFLLKNPIERAMTVKYQVRGPWDDPRLEPLDAPKLNEKSTINEFSVGGN